MPAGYRRVLLVVIDGLRPDAVTPEAMPTLDRLMASGWRAGLATTVRPSVTVAALTSLATGVSPARHGVDHPSLTRLGRVRGLAPLPIELRRHGVETTILASLDAAKVNAIRVVQNTIRLYGWRSLSDDTANYALLNGRDLLNYLVVRSEASLEQFVFDQIDGKGHLLAQIGGVLVGLLEPIRASGGVYERYDASGAFVDPGYLVETGTTVNTLENLANNEVKARISVRVSPSAALISTTIVKVGLLSNL